MASILIIDDDENFLGLVAALLRSAGYTVATADGGASGLSLCKANRYDLVITDIVMPEVDGLKVIQELRQTAPRPRVIALSGDSQFSVPVYLPTAKRLGVERILAKPVQTDVLLETVAHVLSFPALAPVPPAGS